MTALTGLVLDVDDTLYLERDYVRSGFMAVESWLTQEHGVVGVGSEAWRLFRAGRRRTTLGDALEAVCGRLDLLAGCIGVYRSHRPAIRLLPDANSLIGVAVGAIPLAIVTDGPSISQRAKCKALGLDALMNRVVITEELGTSKPDPRVFEAAVEGWTGSGPNFAYVADNPIKDFSAPVQMGWRAFRVRRNGSLHHAVETPPGVLELGSLTSLAHDLAGGRL